MTTQLKNKPKHVHQTYNFKHVINHVDIVQAEAEFVEKYGHLLDDNQLINRTLVDYKTKTITIEASTIKHFHPPKKANKGFIFDLGDNPNTNFYRLVDLFKPLGIYTDDFNFYSKESKVVVTSNKLTKKIIDDAKKVIELENRTNTFTKTYHFDEDTKLSLKDALNCQLNFITVNKLHEDDITYVGINTNPEDSYDLFNTITISGKQSSKHKTYSDDVAAIINSCVIVDRFESLLESALKEGGSDDVIKRVISYQHPVVIDDSLELLEGPVDVNSSLQDVVELIPEEPIIEGNFPTTFNIADFATETLPEPEPQYPTVEIGDKIYDGKVQTSFELQEVTLGQPDKVNHETIHPSDLAMFNNTLYIKLRDSNIINDKLIEVLELTNNDFYYTKDKTAINVTSKHVTVDFIKDKIKQLGGHSKLTPETEIRVFTFSKNLHLDVNDLTKDFDASNLTTVKAFFDDLIQKYNDKHNVKIKPIKFEVDVNTNSASATVEITPNYLKQSTNLEAAVITILYNALLLKQVIDGNTLSLNQV
jgi:hypothetical protein